MHPPSRSRAFTLVELLAAVIVALLAAAALLAPASSSRRLARLGDDQAKLRTMGTATGAYAADSGDRFWSFSWRPRVVYQTQFPDLNNAFNDLDAAANQCIYLLRTRADRTDIPVSTSFVPHFLYSHLVLSDYLAQPFPQRTPVSSGDANRLRWAADATCFDQGCFLPNQPDPGDYGPSVRRWPYSSSFIPTAAFFDQSPVGSRLQQAGIHYQYYTTSTSVLLPQTISSVLCPSQKVMAHDQNAWYFGTRSPYCTHDEARLPMLMAEGSVAVRAAKDANRGWNPNQPPLNTPTSFNYYTDVRPWEPPSLFPGGDVVLGRFRWTRAGLLGRDFGGPETP